MSDDYIIKYSSKDQFFIMVASRLKEWVTQLEDIGNRISVVSGMESFKGVTADSVKAYLNEVHNILLVSARQTILEYQYKVTFFSNGYYNIEPNIYANISSETLRSLIKKINSEKEYLTGQQSLIQSSINRVSDLLPLNNPSQENILGSLTEAAEKTDALDKDISEYEAAQKEAANGSLAELISSLYSAINTFYQTQGQVTGYKSGDYAAKTEVLDLYKNVTSSMEYTAANQEAVIEANDRIQDSFEQQQKDYEAACEARKDEGTANIIIGGLAVVAGVAAIVLTAGAATPVVVVAAASGTCSAAYGVSNIVEGSQDVYYGSIGDLSTDAWNPIRDTVFCGNQALYDTWGNVSLTIAGLCVPVNSAVNAVAGSSGKVIATEVTKTIVKEQVKGYVIGKTSEHVTNYVADEFNLNKTQTVILNQVVETGLEKGVDFAEKKYVKHRDGAADADFTDKMSYEDAKRYNEFRNDPDAYRAKMDQVDLGAFDDVDASMDIDIDIADAPETAGAMDIDIDIEDTVDYSKTANTPEEIAFMEEMEANHEFDVGKESYGPIEVDPTKADPKAPNRRLPTEKHGTIIGDRESGTFEYIPDDPDTQKIMAKYGETSVKYVNDDPNFSPFTKHDSPWGTVEGEVEIGHMVGSREGTADNPGNYQQADVALSEKISAATGQNVTPEQVKAFRESSNLTWHETPDGKTMQLVPTEINADCAHKGGTSAKKYEQAWGDVSLNY